MTLNLRVLAPDQSVYEGDADEVILPSSTGQLGVLTGHVSMLTALDPGVVRLRQAGAWQSIAVSAGFAEVESDEVTVLVNDAELGSAIDQAAAEQALEKAQQALAGFEGQATSPEKLKAQIALSRARARVSAARGS
ncbi:MAG: ATP synthase F1 subunit epsilon [Synechococcaceae cyanobacterium]|nr:ATP synthase F1 subunit epsilon [Synechococcaceae cyanobacterium]